MSTVKSRIRQHVRRWSVCDQCGLCETSINHVLYRGSIPADLMLVGEAPGPSEDVLGKPFVGPAGRVLDRILSDVGAILGHSTGGSSRPGSEMPAYCISNVIACYPTEKDDESRGFRKPTKEEATSCSPRLVELVELVQPTWVVLLGKVAQQYWPLTGLSEDYAERTIGVHHPSYLRRIGATSMSHVEYKRVVLTIKQLIEGG